MNDDDVAVLARLALLSLPLALLPRPYDQAEVEQIATDAHRLAYRLANRVAALEAAEARGLRSAVKPLQWIGAHNGHDFKDGSGGLVDRAWGAFGISFSIYRDRRGVLECSSDGWCVPQIANADEGRALCEARYAAKIMEALIPAPPHANGGDNG